MNLYDVVTGKKYVVEIDRLGYRMCLIPAAMRYMYYLGVGERRCYPVTHISLEEIDKAVRNFPEKHVVAIVEPADVLVRANKTIVMLSPMGLRWYEVWVSAVRARLYDRLKRELLIRAEALFTRIDVDGHVVLLGYGKAVETPHEVEVEPLAPLPTYGDFLRALDVILNAGVVDADKVEAVRKAVEAFATEYARCREELNKCRARLGQQQ